VLFVETYFTYFGIWIDDLSKVQIRQSRCNKF